MNSFEPHVFFYESLFWCSVSQKNIWWIKRT